MVELEKQEQTNENREKMLFLNWDNTISIFIRLKISTGSTVDEYDN